MPDWLPIARRMPITYNKQQMGMTTPILGAVLHTTNSPGANTFSNDFSAIGKAGQWQSAHFMVDHDGNIGQFRSLSEKSPGMQALSLARHGISGSSTSPYIRRN